MRERQTRVNRQIRVPEVRLIDSNGDQRGIMSTAQAQREADDAGLDLVEISPTAKPPVCRIMDFGKYRFEQSKQRAEQKKKQKVTHIKEVKFRPGTDIGDYQVKLRKIMGFLERGDRVKVSLRFRGREMQHRELGLELLNRIKSDLENIVVEQEPKMEGRQMMMVITQGKAEKTQAKKEDKQDAKTEDN